MDQKTRKTIAASLRSVRSAAAKLSGGITATTPDKSLLRLAKNAAEKELLYYLDNGVSRYLGDILQHSSGDDESALRHKTMRQLMEMAKDMADRGLVVEDKDGAYRRSDFALDMDAVREMAFKALPMAKTMAEFLAKLKEQIPESHRGFENISKALDAAEELVAEVRSVGHSFE